MDFCAQFHPNGIFGAYPDGDRLEQLRKLGVTVLVDLTDSHDKVDRYDPPPDMQYTNYPIGDHSSPKNWQSFCKLIIKIETWLKTDHVYVHCRGGHSRSGLIVAVLLRRLIPDITAEQAIERTTELHNSRIGLKQKWKDLGCPQTRCQKNLVFRLFSPFAFSRSYRTGTKAGFSTFTKHPIEVPFPCAPIDDASPFRLSLTVEAPQRFCLFQTVETAYLCMKAPLNTHYVSLIREQITVIKCVHIAKTQECENPDWGDETLYDLTRLKYEQHPYLIPILLQTGFREIIDTTTNTHPDNLVGRILMRLREEFRVAEPEGRRVAEVQGPPVPRSGSTDGHGF